MYTTRPSRMWRNKKYSMKCQGKHEYFRKVDVIMCVNCGRIHKRRTARLQGRLAVSHSLNKFTDKFTKKVKDIAKVYNQRN